MTRYVIIGAGAVGGTIGARLVQAGIQTQLVARGQHLTALRADGLRLRTPEEDVTLAVAAAAGPEEVDLRTDDVLVASTKTQQLLPVLSGWADRPVRDSGSVIGTAGELLPLLCATNGVAAETLARRYFARVYGVCLWLPANLVAPGEVVALGIPVSGVLHVGRVPAAVAGPTDETLLQQLAADWTAARVEVRLPRDVMPWKYRKLLSNLGNVFEALTGQQEEVRSLRDAAETEARAVLDAAGVTYTADTEEAAARADGFAVGSVRGIEGHLGGSTWQSLQRGTGDIETDYLNGEIVAIAHGCGRRAPINAALARLGRDAAARRRRPGEVSPRELAEALGLA